MNRKLADYIEAGKALDPDQREVAAIALQQVDDPARAAEVDAAWDEEIDSRVEEILTGKVELVSGEETLRIGRARLSARRT